jgi:phosphoglycerate dehydrogenase-like enzyme
VKIVMIGEASAHISELEENLTFPNEFVSLPLDAAFSADYDDEISGADVVVSLKFSREHNPPDFRLLHVPGAGLDGINFNSLPAACQVCNVFEHEIPIAEFVAWAMLDWVIRPKELQCSFRNQKWVDTYRSRVPHAELYGKTLGIAGFGRIGQAIARRAQAFGMHIVAVDQQQSPFAADIVHTLLSPKQLPELLAQADFVVIACPLNAQTKSLINAANIRCMKSTAVVINVSRAEIIDEQDLYEALHAKVIAGAYLDVWYRYPVGGEDDVLPSRFRFDQLPGVCCTPHSSAWTHDLFERRYAFVAKNINRLKENETLENVVWPSKKMAGANTK